MFASGNVVYVDKLERGLDFLILHIYKREYGQIILQLHKHWEANIYVWLTHNYINHFPTEFISEINPGSIFFKMKYESYLKYVFLELQQ